MLLFLIAWDTQVKVLQTQTATHNDRNASTNSNKQWMCRRGGVGLAVVSETLQGRGV